MSKKTKQPETRGRPSMPPDLRRATLSVRVPRYTLDILRARVKARHPCSSSIGLEIQRAVDATSTIS